MIFLSSELEEDDDDEETVTNIESQHEQSEKDKYLEENTHSNDTIDATQSIKKRVKRQSDYEYTPTKTRCPLLLVADYRFFQEMGASNTKTTISYLVRSIVLFLGFRTSIT